MSKKIIKEILIYAGILLMFALCAYGFMPELLDGKIVNQSDISGWRGMAQEAIAHNKANPDDPTGWSNSMFGGMPTCATIDNFKGDITRTLYDFLLKGKRPASFLLVSLAGAFLLMLSMGINRILAVAGAIAVTFCSYNLQIIQVGHNTKMQAIAFLPWVLAGIIFTYRSALSEKGSSQGWKGWLPKTLLGAVLFALALGMQIKANHVQITYYLAIIIFVYAIGLLISLCIDKTRRQALGRFFAASAMLLIIGCIGIATNTNKLLPIYEYTPYTMRGGSELSADKDTHNDKGLDLGYATAWSYGIEEMPNLLIPNFNGGASAGPLDMDSETGRLLKRAGQPNLRQTLKQMPLYWGPQPFTAGPMYMGALSVFLFVLGLFLVRGREKWWILAATIIAVLLSWGSHLMWFTRLWFEYVPFYNKFRTVSMALVVLQVTLPLLGFLVLDRILKGEYETSRLIKAGGIAYGITAGFCLLSALFPAIAGTFTTSADARMPEILVEALALDRQDLLKGDAIRSFVLITICFALVLWTVKGKGQASERDRKYRSAAVGAAVTLIVLFDLFSVGARYLNDEHFITPKNFEAQYVPRPVDKILFEDKDPDFRVLDVSCQTFSNSLSSYHHKTIGGYSPIKMQRYQDLIDRYLAPEMDRLSDAETVQELQEDFPYLQVISMLNGKYLIFNPNYPPIRNPYAMGHAWFVDSFVPAQTPDEEIALLGSIDPAREAIIGKDFEWAQKAISSGTSSDHITLTRYAPNELRYSFKTGSDRTAVFSEVYYPNGWKAWIEPAGKYGEVRNGHYRPTADAMPVELFRADWILRAAVIPQGEGELIMRYEPDSYRIGEAVSRASSITLIILLLLSTGGSILFGRKH